MMPSGLRRHAIPESGKEKSFMTYAYYEIQYFAWWVYLIFAFVAVLFTWLILNGHLSAKLGLGVGFFLLVIVMATLRMTTYIEEQSLTVYFGWIPALTKTIPLSDIQDVRVCSYDPLKQLGMGWRYGQDGNHALTAKGTQGVCFRLQDGSKFIVGSPKSEKLAQAMQQKHADSEVD